MSDVPPSKRIRVNNDVVDVVEPLIPEEPTLTEEFLRPKRFQEKRILCDPDFYKEPQLLDYQPNERRQDDAWPIAINNYFGHRVVSNTDLQKVGVVMEEDRQRSGNPSLIKLCDENGNYAVNLIDTFFQWHTNYQLRRVTKTKMKNRAFPLNVITSIVQENVYLILLLQIRMGHKKTGEGALYHQVAVRKGIVFDDKQSDVTQQIVRFENYVYNAQVTGVYELVKLF